MDPQSVVRRFLAILIAVGLTCSLFAEVVFAEEQIVYTKPHRVGVCPYAFCTETWIANSDGSNPQLITTAGDVPSLSPDGQLVAVMHDDNKKIEVYTTDGRLRETYTGYMGGIARRPRFSPDGQSLIYQGSVQSAQDILSISRKTAISTPLIDWLNDQATPTFSPDGRKIAFSSITDPDGEFNSRIDRGPLPYSIYTANSDGTNPLRVTPLSMRKALLPKFSPDGRQIVFEGTLYQRRIETSGTWVINTDGSNLHMVTTPGGNPDWSPDGSRIVFSKTGGIWTMQPDGTNVQQIIRDSAASSPSFRQPRSTLDLEQALKDFAPQIRYDEQESFFADSAGEMTDNPGNSLQREDSSVIASSSGLPPNQLSLGFLASPTYANGATVIESDFLDASDDYEIDAQQMHSNPLYANQIYGHAYRKNDRWWLQYWFFYYYNPQEVLGVGVHEGDWEGIQLELDANGTPVSASYAQHDGGQSCAWDETERIWIDDRVAPVVYSARASHASYFFPGVYRGGLDPLPDDYATGTGLVVNPEVTSLDDALPAWVTWPGSWGASGNSPPGPKFNGERWIDPQDWAASLDGCPSSESLSMTGLSAPSVPAPKIDLERQRNGAYVAYQFPEWPSNSDAQPRMLVISIDPAGHSEAGLPYTAITRSYPVDSDHGQVVVQPLGLGTAPYVVRVSAFSEDGVRSEVISRVMK